MWDVPYFLQTVISRAKTLRADSLLDSLRPQGVRWLCQNLTFPRVQSASFKLELTNFHLPPTLGLAIIKLINFDHEIHLNTIERFGTNQVHQPFLLRKLKIEYFLEATLHVSVLLNFKERCNENINFFTSKIEIVVIAQDSNWLPTPIG